MPRYHQCEGEGGPEDVLRKHRDVKVPLAEQRGLLSSSLPDKRSAHLREGTTHFLTAALAPRLNVHALPHPPEPSQTSSCDPVAYCLVSVYPDRPATRTVLVPEEEEKEPCPGRRALKEVMEGEVKRTHILKAIKLGGGVYYLLVHVLLWKIR